YFKNGDLDSAMMMYKKGTEVQPTNPLGYVGVGKVLLYQGKEQDGNASLFKGKTLGAKNANAFMELAEVYITVPPPYKNLMEANKLLTDAIKWEPKNPEAHILMGDNILEQNPTEGGSAAIKEYDKALELNPKSPKAVLREGKLYSRARNYNLALDYYKKAIAIDPTFAPAHREIAEIYHMANQDGKALENIEKYLQLNNGSLSAHKRYASFMFLNKKYPEAIKEIEDIVKKDPKDCYMWRILGYAYYELGNATDKDAFTKGLDAINKFFAGIQEKKDFKMLPDDYKYKGLLLGKTGQDSLGAAEIEKAIAQDPDKNCELNGEIGKMFLKSKKYEKAIIYYEKKAACPNSKGLNGADNFDLGRAYYYLAGSKEKEASEIKDAAAKTKKETEAAELFVKADTCFSRLTQQSPAFSTGYFMRGNVNIHLDPKNDKWLAKPHFEKAMSIVKPEERTLPANKNYVITACEYLGYHYLKNKDNAKAKEYFTILKELDPNNKKATDFFKSPEGK
ncbi:MAG TPA: tetratricopeptide repeat protein, partial [Bacteroidia bacterium]|nr:tetratricopeptide repeat protein [Bacteroidia bacterium]